MSRKILAVLGRRVYSERRGERIATPGRARTTPVSNRTRPRHGGLVFGVCVFYRLTRSIVPLGRCELVSF